MVIKYCVGVQSVTAHGRTKEYQIILLARLLPQFSLAHTNYVIINDNDKLRLWVLKANALC